MPTDLDTAGFFHACPDGVAVIDSESGRVLRTNDECADICARSRDALEGASLSGLAPPDWEPDRALEELLADAGGDTVSFDWRVEQPDGTAVSLRCSMRTFVDRGEKRALVTVREHPDPELDESTRESPDQRELIDGMNDVVLVVDMDGNYVDANRVAVERLGYDREALLSMGPADISPPDQAERVGDRLRTIEDNETLTFESVQVTADGEEIPVEINARRITYDGEPAVLSVARDVSDRKERLRRLRTLEQAVEQAGHAVYVTDHDGTIEYVNPAFEQMTGYDAADVVGETPSILNAGTEDEDYYERLWETILDGEVWEEEIENERADGEHFCAEQTIAPITEDGEVVRFVAVMQDVSDRKRREEELERYRELIENVPVGVYRNSPGMSAEFEAVNPAMVEMFDADSREELLEMPVATLYRTPDQREQFTRKLDRKGRVIDEELRLETLDGDTFWGAVTALRHEIDGEVYYDGIIQDVTERRETERKLRIREQRFRRLFEDHNAPMLLVDPDTGTIERANEAAAEFYGYERDQLTSMAIQEINRLDDEEVARRRQAADDLERNRFVFPHELADGTVRQVEVDSSPIHTGDQRVLFSILHDVTERERTRERLERQNEQLEVLNRVVRHDIRNDMTVVLSRAELLDSHVHGEGQEHLDSVIEHSEHAVELTKTVRELMETMLDDQETDPGTVTLSRMLAAEVEDAETGYSHAEFTVTDSLPDAPVRGNEMLSSVFRNILNNAIQHNDKETPRIEVSVDDHDDSVVVHIADNGPGVPDGQKEEIFGKGEHGIESSGTGLGLYLVHTFVEQFGGDVWVTDNDPVGAVFHVELPKAGTDQ